MHMADGPWPPAWLVHYWKRGGWRGRAIVIGVGALCGLWLVLIIVR